MKNRLKIGLVGCGNISGIYLKNLTQYSKHTEIFACADLIEENAVAVAKEYNIPNIMTLDEMLKSPEIDIILNLTPPKSHYSITKMSLLSNKHVYCEKPLAVKFSDGEELCRIAKEKNLFLGCAPDTFMGVGIQTAKKLIDAGKVGEIIGGNAFMMCHGHESWHPNPDFYYEAGGGPMLDMGPYYLTALVNLLGSIKRIHRINSTPFEYRTITSKPKFGQKIKVETPTHICGLLQFESGAVCTITTSFDVWKHSMPNIELYGTEGSITVPDPNIFGGDVLYSERDGNYNKSELINGCFENSRGIGVDDMANCIVSGLSDFSANSQTALHVLEAMCALIDAKNEEIYEMKTKANLPKNTPHSF